VAGAKIRAAGAGVGMNEILLFDDDPQICDVLEAALAKSGCAVRRADSLEQAEAIICHEPIILVLADMPMFRFAGAKLGTFAAAHGVRVLMMVAGEDVTFRAEAAGLPYIVKPFRLARIIDAVRALTARG
jgi:DNA-binding NtrC family response regulator